eukprot:gene4225-5204_t
MSQMQTMQKQITMIIAAVSAGAAAVKSAGAGEAKASEVPLRMVKTYVTDRLSYLKNNNKDGPDRWKWKQTTDYPDGFYIR